MQKDRFKGLDWVEKAQSTPVLIGGAGGIGSWAGFAIVRAGIPITSIDYDRVEESNLGGQCFPENSIGKLKIEALTEVIRSFSGVVINTFEEEIKETFDTNSNIVIAAFDNIPARKILFESWLKSTSEKDTPCYFIDPRLEAEFYYIYTINRSNKVQIEAYKNILEKDGEQLIDDGDCTVKQTTHIAMMCGGHICSIVTSCISNAIYEENIKTIPFKVRFDGKLNRLKQSHESEI